MPATGLPLLVQLIDPIQVKLVKVDIEVDPILTTLKLSCSVPPTLTGSSHIL